MSGQAPENATALVTQPSSRQTLSSSVALHSHPPSLSNVMHIPNRSSRTAHIFETSLLTFQAAVTLALHPEFGLLPRLLLLLQTLLAVHNFPLTRSKCASLRRTTDKIGLGCGVALPLSLLPAFPTDGAVFLLTVATTTLVCAWRGSVSATTERIGVLCSIVVVLSCMEHWGVAVVAVFVPAVQRRFIGALPKCFTVAEGAIVAGGACGVVAMGMRRIFDGRVEGCDMGEEGLKGMMITGLVGGVLAGVVGVGDVVRRRKGGGWRRLGVVIGGIVVPTYGFGWGFGAGCEPFGWVWKYLMGNWKRVGLFGWWMGVVGIVLGLGGILGEVGVNDVVVRKGYHLAAMGIFGAGVAVDEGLTGFAAAVGVAGLVLMEMGRVCGVGWVERMVHEVGGKLVDEKDRGLVKVTHVYLLVGCGMGLWMGWGSGVGIVTVCVLDSMAAVGGKMFGKVEWFGRGRTVEGSLFGVVCGVMMGRVWGELEGWVGWKRMVWACVMAGGVEATTGQIDNLVLPLVCAAVMRM